MDENILYYSLIQDFEADFLLKDSLKILNSAIIKIAFVIYFKLFILMFVGVLHFKV